MQQSHFIDTCNAWAGEGTPFLFIIDYELEQFRIFRPDEAARQGVFYNIRGRTNVPGGKDTVPPGFRFEAVPMAFPRYEKAFSLVKKHIMHGNSFLLNLTFPTPLRTDLTLQQIFHGSVAPYRLLYGDRFVVFSPETFVTIGGDTIRSFPMKGTIDASLPGAERQLLGNEKELWEHNTIVDLIRNDLSMVARDVRVTRFRYVDRIRTHRGELLQVSSEIEGRLADGWRSRLGELLLRMLPAGSISGAPKRKTVEIIAEAEGEKRGFFTGIFGIFDGESVDSAVMIRYIERAGAGRDIGRDVGNEVRNTVGNEVVNEAGNPDENIYENTYENTDGATDGNAKRNTPGKQATGMQVRPAMGGKANGGLQFRSGGGITGHSEAAAEYKEMIEKVYVPIVRV